MKQWLSFILVLALASTACFGVSAEVMLSETAGFVGDLDEDRSVTASDALSVLKYVVGKESFDQQKMLCGDVNASGKVDASDALEILRHVVGKIDSFAAGTIKDAYALSDYEYVDPLATYEAYVNSDFDYNTSLSVNGAYANDTTADCSFVMNNTGLSAKTIYQVNISAIGNKSFYFCYDERRLLFSLQGLLNRDFGRDADHTSVIYVIDDTGGSAALSDYAWLDYMQREGSVFNDYAVVTIDTWEDFFATFEAQIKQCGMILWDGNVPATANVAATVCGLDGYLPVLAKSPLHDQLAEKGIEEKQTLVGLFQNGKKGEKIADTHVISTGSAKNDAYRWALEKYFDRCSANYLAYTLDGAVTINGYQAYENHPSAMLYNASKNCLSNHDYLIARRCFFFDLSPNVEEICDDIAQQEIVTYACPLCGNSDIYLLDALLGIDDPICAACGETFVVDWGLVSDQNLIGSMAQIGTDQETMLMIYDARYKRAGGAMGQLMGFPPWWVKYTDFQSRETDPPQGTQQPTWMEWLYCELISCYNLAKEADAESPSSMTNGSVYYKYVPMLESYENNFEEYDSGITYNDDTTYFTLYLGDYDSSAWLKRYTYHYIMNETQVRSRLPLTWCFNPNLSMRVPMIFDYIYDNKYEHEFFAAGDSGAGYVIPSGLFGGSNLNYSQKPRPADYANGDTMWANYCKAFYDRFDMKATGFIINGANTLTTDILGMFNTFSTMGGLHNNVSAVMTRYKDAPYLYCQNGIDTNTDMNVLYEHAFTVMADYNFAAYRTVCISPAGLEQIINNFTAYATEKGDNVQYVELHTFLKLAKDSGKGYKID